MCSYRISAALFALFVGLACAQQEHPSAGPARAALETFKELVSAQNYQRMGFESLEEVAMIKLGEPVPLYHIGLDKLKAFPGGEDASTLLTDQHEVIFPIMVNDNVRSSIAVKKRDETWEAAAYGQANMTKALTEVRQAHSQESGLRYSDYFALQVPAMYLLFIGHHADGKLMLTPVYDNEEYGFKAGETESGQELVANLVKYAQDFEGALRPPTAEKN